jgi:hypothetical protein
MPYQIESITLANTRTAETVYKSFQGSLGINFNRPPWKSRDRPIHLDATIEIASLPS